MKHSTVKATVLGSTGLLTLFLATAAWGQTVGDQQTQVATGKVETVVVTAEKRTEAETDVPMGVTAISGDELLRNSSFRMEDFAGNIPGLVFLDEGGGESRIVLRGLTTGGADVSSGVAVYIDDTPYLPSNPFAGPAAAAPDLDAFDMQRVEVLKGPQGTLYGANALGGIFKYVTSAPDPTAFAATLQGGVSTVDNGHIGYDTHVMVNIPLADDLAFRAVVYDDYYPGFIDDPSRGVKDINSDRFSGGRASLLYQPTSDFSIRFNILYQHRTAADLGGEDVHAFTFQPIYGNLTQERYLAQPEANSAQNYNMTINWDAGFAKLVSSTSYISADSKSLTDLTPIYGIILGGGVREHSTTGYRTITQEVRLASEDVGPLQWQVGVYYTQQQGHFYGNQDIFTIPSGASFFPIDNFKEPTLYREYAGFASVDYSITPTLDVSAGGRYSENNQKFVENLVYLGTPSPSFGKSDEGAFTYSADARWHFTPQNMLYARIASGFAPGGPNDQFPGDPLPKTYQSTTTVNYEVGIKSNLLDSKLTAEVSVYDIQWSDIQIGVSALGFSGYDNGGGAQSRGVEWNFQYVPVDGLKLGFNGAYTDAHLTQTLDPATTFIIANNGDRLPYVPTWSNSLTADYETPLFGDYNGFVGVNYRYTGGRGGDFPDTSSPVARETIPGFGIFDLRAGVETQVWSLTFYVKNVGNTLGINRFTQIDFPQQAGFKPGDGVANIYTPRTIGFTAIAHF